ncbi:MAG TPA: CpsB/CapC family capsule biosynthesis tyrosine phosphatase [Thermoanaerobaculia bacterium]|jgi:protein-tyrosine phosphatase|nr:CpsB/CapC family capsule biosynthesis tyrosine phosphatase [Thermoanaerobaculia bacterium]
MIDIHHHCLPGVDDGPRELSQAAEMCLAAAEEGIDTIIATPHVLRGRWRAFSRKELESRLVELQERVGASPRIVLGSEYFFGHDMADVLREGLSILPLAAGRYVLLELPANSVPPMFNQPLYRAQLEGWLPVLAHPERNLVFQAQPDLLAALIGHGLRVQITATSLTGAFGSEARTAAELFLRRGLVHFVATDAHNMDKRPPRMKEALAALRSLTSDERVEALTVENPRAVLENRALPYDPEPEEVRVPGLFTRLRSFFRTNQA